MIPVVLFFQSTSSKSWREKLSGVYRYAREAGWQVQVINTRGKRDEIVDALEFWQPVGCIVDRAMTLARTPVKVFRRTPFVLLDQNPQTAVSSASCLVHDSAASARLAAKELLSTGADAFSYIPWQTPVFWSRQREAAFSDVLRAAGKRYLKWTGSFDDLPKPCGILCANDITAQRAMSLATKSGWKIPGDLFFVGIDNDELICENLTPTLTSVLPDFEAAGYSVARLLHEALNGHPPRQATYGPVGIVRRESTRRFGKSDARVTRALAYIRIHAFETSLKTEDIIREMGCSRRLADLRFHDVTQHTILDEIHRVRLEKAYSLLRKRGQSIGSIANLCGYASEPFFKRLFKRETGLSMRDWRKRHGQDKGHYRTAAQSAAI